MNKMCCMKTYKVVECNMVDCSYKEIVQWKEQLSLFIVNYAGKKCISVFDPVSESDLKDYLPHEFIFKYNSKDYFFAYGMDITPDDVNGILSSMGFVQEYCAFIPSLLSDAEKIELVGRWDGDRACSNIEIFTKGNDGETFKWYNPSYSDAEKILSEQLDIDSSKLEIKTRQVLESAVDKNDNEKYDQWKNRVLSFIYDYIKGKSITFIEPDHKKRKLSHYVSKIKKVKDCSKKMYVGYLEDGIAIDALSHIINDSAFRYGKIALIPSFLSEFNLMMLFNYWGMDKVSIGLEMFMMDNEGKSFKWYNPSCENSYELFDSCFGNE